MQIEVYCDEAHPDALSSTASPACFLMIGSLWLPGALRPQLKQAIDALRQRFGVWGEMKWRKVSPSRLAFYEALVDLYLEYGEDLRFRCIAVNRTTVDLSRHAHDAELGFYKFYYQLIHHWIRPGNTYRIFCDLKSNRDPKRLPVLARCLSNSRRDAVVDGIQSLPSDEVVLLQLCDVLLGVASSRLNGTLHAGTAKAALVERLERALGYSIGHTRRDEKKKFNVFVIRLQGGLQ